MDENRATYQFRLWIFGTFDDVPWWEERAKELIDDNENDIAYTLGKQMEDLYEEQMYEELENSNISDHFKELMTSRFQEIDFYSLAKMVINDLE